MRITASSTVCYGSGYSLQAPPLIIVTSATTSSARTAVMDPPITAKCFNTPWTPDDYTRNTTPPCATPSNTLPTACDQAIRVPLCTALAISFPGPGPTIGTTGAMARGLDKESLPGPRACCKLPVHAPGDQPHPFPIYPQPHRLALEQDKGMPNHRHSPGSGKYVDQDQVLPVRPGCCF